MQLNIKKQHIIEQQIELLKYDDTIKLIVYIAQFLLLFNNS